MRNFAAAMELDRHIEILLLDNDCVIVPGLGGFTASHVEAKYDDTDGMFLPPLRTLGFNPKLCVNDSLLVQSYTEAYDISYPEACNRIDSEVEELKQHIDNTGSFTLNNIGTLYLNGNNALAFTPCESGILTPGLYSLSSFEMKPLSAVAVQQPAKTASSSSATLVMPLVAPDTEELEQRKSSSADKTIQIKLSVLRNVAAAVIAVIIFFALALPVENSNNYISTSSVGGFTEMMTAGSQSSARQSKAQLSQTSPAQHNVQDRVEAAVEEKMCQEKTSEKPSTQVSVPTDNYYCIVLASRVSRTNAQAFVEQLHASGHAEAKVLTEHGKSAKVVYGQYASAAEAQSRLSGMRSQKEFKEAWVYHVN